MKHNISLLMIVSCLTAAFQTPVFAVNAAIGKSALPLSGATKRLLSPTSKALGMPLPGDPSGRIADIIAQMREEQKIFLETVRSGMEGKAAKEDLAKAKVAKKNMPTAITDSSICSDAFVITNEKLPLVITEPGVWTVPCDLQYKVDFDPLNPFKPFKPAIQILSNDVTIDFKGHTLSQDGCDPTGYGVVIGEGYFFTDLKTVYKNITLKSGTVRDFTGCGILAYNATFLDPIAGAKLPYENLHFIDLNILHNGSDSAYFDSFQGLQLSSFADPNTLASTRPEIAFQGVVLERVCVNESFCGLLTGHGIFIVTADNVIVRDLQCNHTQGNGAFGLQIFANNLQMINGQANSTRSNEFYPLALEVPCIRRVVGALLVGFNIFIKNWQFNESYSECCAVAGCDIAGGNVLAEDSQFNNSRGGKFFGLVAGGGITGVALNPLTQSADTIGSGFKFVRCQMDGSSIAPDNEAGADSISGIFAAGVTDLACYDCQIANHTSDAPHITALGVVLVGVGSASFTRCTITNIRANEGAIGIVSDNTFSNIFGAKPSLVVTDSIIGEVLTTSADFFNAGILRVAAIPGNVNFYAARNRITGVRADPTNPVSAAIALLGVAGPVVEENVISDCQRGILLLSGADLPPAQAVFNITTIPGDISSVVKYGWQVKPETYPANNRITNCQQYTNTRTNETVTIEFGKQVRGDLFPDVDISTWRTDDPIVYRPCPDGVPVQLFDSVTGLNQVPYSGRPAVCFPATVPNPNGSTAGTDPALGTNTILGVNAFFTPDMVGGTIQIGNAAPVRITKWINPLQIEVEPSPATAQAPFTVIYPNNGELAEEVSGLYFVFIPPAQPVPGDTEKALIQGNTVTGSGVGIEDTRKCTSSLFLENVAFCNDINYKVNWCGRPPVACGNVNKGKFPKSKENLSVKCAS